MILSNPGGIYQVTNMAVCGQIKYSNLQTLCQVIGEYSFSNLGSCSIHISCFVSLTINLTMLMNLKYCVDSIILVPAQIKKIILLFVM